MNDNTYTVIPTEGDDGVGSPARIAAGPMNLVVYVREDRVAAMIAAAIREARTVPDGYIIDKGVVRKVLGELPVTADGCVIGDVDDTGAELWYAESDGSITRAYMTLHFQWPGSESDEWYITENGDLGKDSRWFSTREAALAAKDSKGGGA